MKRRIKEKTLPYRQLYTDTRTQMAYRIDADHYELLAHWAYDAGHNSIQQTIDSRVFPKAWRVQLKELRKKHRRQGLPDEKFYKTIVKKNLGIEHELGRHTKLRPPKSLIVRSKTVRS